jgi:hypothetical protein
MNWGNLYDQALQEIMRRLIMKNLIFFFIMALSFTLSVCAQGGAGNTSTGGTMKITVGNRELTATLAQNSSTEALKELLKAGPISIHMRDYGNMEKVGGLGKNLPTNDERITTGPGDLILYQGNSFVIYYAPNTWTFTRLGKINGVTQAELKKALGEGDVTVTLELMP